MHKKDQAATGLTISAAAISQTTWRLQQCITEHRWDEASHQLSYLRHASRRGSLRLGSSDFLDALDASDTPRLRRKALRLAQSLEIHFPNSDEMYRVLFRAGSLADGLGRFDQAAAYFTKAAAAAPDSVAGHIRIHYANLLLRQRRVAEAIDTLRTVEPVGVEAQFALRNLHAAIAMMNGEDLRTHADALRRLAAEIHLDPHARRETQETFLSRALHMKFYVALQEDDRLEAARMLRHLEVGVVRYSSQVSDLDRTAARIASTFSLAQIEYAVAVSDERQVSRALVTLYNTRSRVAAAVGSSSDLTMSLDLNAALAEIWLSGTRSISTRQLIANVRDLESSLGYGYPEALSAAGVLSSALSDRNGKESETRSRGKPKSSKFTDSQRAKSTNRAIPTMRLEDMTRDDIVTSLGGHVGDSGRTEVQLALLQKRILALTEHLKQAPNDHSSRQGLFQLIGQRRRLLTYLESQSVTRYRAIQAMLRIRPHRRRE